MKKIFLKTLYLGIVLCIAGLSGCQNPLNPPKEAPAPQGTGRVVVTIVDAAANGSARTIAPDAGGFAKYTLTFSGLEDEPPRPPADITMGGSVTGTLPVGPWTITATGYIEVEGSYVASAEGSAEVDVVSGQSVPLTIILGPKTGGGQGTFAYSLKIPSGLTGSDLIIRSAEGGAVAAIPLAHDPEGITGSVELNPGQYLALIRLQKGEGGAALYAGLTEALHIYSGLISALPPQEFTDADFTAAVSDFDLTSLVPAPVVWSDPVAALSGNQYTGTIAWTESDDTPVAGIFEPGTAYKAVVTLTAGSNYTLTGVPADSFAHSGATTITNTANSGVITIIFPATDESSITGVTVSPASSSVAKGSTGVLTAAVTATGTAPPPQTVVWTVEGNNDSATTIFLSPSPGFGPAQVANLTIATNETASTLTVKATSTVDDSQYGTATVTVTAAPVITISSRANLARIGVDPAYPLGGTYRLTANLTLSDWTPIGDATTPFYGSFDGNGRTITLQSFSADAVSGKTYLGIFGYVQGRSVTSKAGIKNLVVNSQINQNVDPAMRQAVGILAGYAANTEIEDITLQGTFTFGSTKTIYLGGIAGYIQTGTVVKDSRVTAVLDIASGNGPSPTNITGSPAQAYSFIGGVAGIFAGGAEILDSHNTGDIQAFSTVSASQVFAGGIAGGSYYGSGTAYQGKIEGCSYTGDLHARAMGFWTFAGGIAGTIVGGTTASIDSTTRIVRSFATGTISVEGTNSGNPYIGGIVGYNYYGALVSQSYFAGNVIASKSGDYTGGIAGYNSQTGAPNNSRIEDCWSSGTVTGFNNAGGIVGQNQVNTYIRRCYSTATVTATNTGVTGVGGIAGYNASIQEDAIIGNFALNPSLSIGSGTSANIHRIAGNNVATIKLTKNYAWSGMTMTRGGTSVAPTDIGANAKDGADIATNPSQTDYEALGWDFGAVWTMDSYGYPKLRWQTADTPRAPLAGPVPVVAVENYNHYDSAASEYTTDQGGKLRVSWAPVPGATSYDIYYAPRITTAPEITEAVAVSGVTGTSREIIGTAIGENTMNYYVWITAKNSVGSGKESAPSSTLDWFLGGPDSTLGEWWSGFDTYYFTSADILYEPDGYPEWGWYGYVRAVTPDPANSRGVMIFEYDRDTMETSSWSLDGDDDTEDYFSAQYYTQIIRPNGTLYTQLSTAYAKNSNDTEVNTVGEALARFDYETGYAEYVDSTNMYNNYMLME